MRVVALITIAACALAGGACSKILGIDDPTPAGAGGDGPGGPDADVSGLESLAFSGGAFELNQQQIVHVKVTGTFKGGTTRDVTANASVTSNDDSIAKGAQGGIVEGVSPGPAVMTARIGTVESPPLNVTVSTRTCAPVINEFQTGTAAAADNEWVEIYNPCKTAFTVDSWTLVYRSQNATSDTGVLATLVGQLAPEAIRLYAGPGYGGPFDGTKWTGALTLAQANGALAIRRDDTMIADAVTYGTVASTTFLEGSALLAMMNDMSAARLPFDGRDDGNGSADFKISSMRTPKASNVMP